MNTTAKSILLLTAAALLSSCGTTAVPAAASTPANTGGIKPYPLKTCIITGNGLGSMGDEQRIVHQGQEIKFCCEPCVGKFQKNPAKYLSKL